MILDNNNIKIIILLNQRKSNENSIIQKKENDMYELLGYLCMY